MAPFLFLSDRSSPSHGQAKVGYQNPRGVDHYRNRRLARTFDDVSALQLAQPASEMVAPPERTSLGTGLSCVGTPLPQQSSPENQIRSPFQFARHG